MEPAITGNEVKLRSSKTLIRVLSLAVIAGCIIHVITIFMRKWRVNDKIVYKYQYKGRENQQTVGKTEYGLDTIAYDNGGTIVSWDQRIERSKAKGFNAIQEFENDNAQFELFTGVCPPACREAISTRITGYETIRSMNLIIKITIIVCLALCLCGALWSLITTKGTFVGYIWIAVSLGCGGINIWWFNVTEEVWNNIITHQQIPKPFVSRAFFGNLLATIIYGLSGFCWLLSGFVNRWLYKRQLSQAFKHQYSELQQNDLNKETECRYTFNNNMDNAVQMTNINSWCQPNNVNTFTNPNVNYNNNGFWNGVESGAGNFIPPGL